MAKWLPIHTAPMDGVEVLLGVEIAGVWVTRAGSWDNGELWEIQGCECQEDAEGWWSYTNSVSQDRLEGIYAPTHWAPMPDRE